MGFLTGIISATVKTVITPVAVVKDVYNVVTDEEADNTKRLLESAADDVEEATDDLCDGDLL